MLQSLIDAKGLRPLIAVFAGLVVGLVVVSVAGENPFHLAWVLARGAFGSRYDLGMTLFYSTPLIFTGLAVAIPYRAGLFNIGAEGQLMIGALGAAAIGVLFPTIGWPGGVILGALGAFLAGGIWGGIAGALKAFRGSHEVINTIMLNFISFNFCSYFTLYILKSTDSQNTETGAVGAGYLIHRFGFFDDAPVGWASVGAVLLCFAVWLIFKRTRLGFEIQAVGQSEQAAKIAGIRVQRVKCIVFLLAGGIAGCVGISEVLGNAGRFRLGFSPGFGYTGIAVAFLGRNHPLGILAASLLFGALHKGTLNLDLETEKVTRDLSLILQAVIILIACADGLWDRFKRARTS